MTTAESQMLPWWTRAYTDLSGTRNCWFTISDPSVWYNTVLQKKLLKIITSSTAVIEWSSTCTIIYFNGTNYSRCKLNHTNTALLFLGSELSHPHYWHPKFKNWLQCTDSYHSHQEARLAGSILDTRHSEVGSHQESDCSFHPILNTCSNYLYKPP